MSVRRSMFMRRAGVASLIIVVRMKMVAQERAKQYRKNNILEIKEETTNVGNKKMFSTP